MSITIEMSVNQLRVIRHALLNCNMTDFISLPEDDMDLEASDPQFMADMASDTLIYSNDGDIHGWNS
jgi:hypothetical protein